jgi:hypothetical protein
MGEAAWILLKDLAIVAVILIVLWFVGSLSAWGARAFIGQFALGFINWVNVSEVLALLGVVLLIGARPYRGGRGSTASYGMPSARVMRLAFVLCLPQALHLLQGVQ